MIRVLHIFKVMHRGGAETMTMNVYRKIDRTKIQFDFLCLSNEVGEYEEEIAKLGGRIFRIAPPSESGYIRHIKNIVEICKKNGPYKAIHCPTLFHSGIACMAGYIAKIPIRISHAHSAGTKDKSIFRTVYQYICRILIKMFATDKIACGEKARDFLFGNSKKTKQEVLILYNGIDLEKYSNVTEQEIIEVKRELNLEDKFIIGHVGSFYAVKNQKFFIELAKKYKEEKKDVKILLVGDGELKEKIEMEIKENQLQDYFVLPGVREDIYKIMNAIDIFVMPSLYEGFPMVIIEALASGKNCVVSDSISSETQVVPNSIRFLSLDEDKSIWVREIEEMAKRKVNKAERIETLEQKGFSVTKTAQILENIYLKDKDKNEK